jgi:SAM-dependent methyltransferase
LEPLANFAVNLLSMNDSSHPGFWHSRYVSGQTPWDFGGVPSDLQKYLRRNPNGGRVLVPGCGTGYEVKAFIDAGYEVVAIDLALAAVSRAHKLVGPSHAKCIKLADFFQQPYADASFDLIYERTFLCAIAPEQRLAYRDRIARLLKYSGQFIGYFYYQKTEPADGPPYGLVWGEGDALFSQHFLLMNDEPVADSLPIFTGRERWQERRRGSKPVASIL